LILTYQKQKIYIFKNKKKLQNCVSTARQHAKQPLISNKIEVVIEHLLNHAD